MPFSPFRPSEHRLVLLVADMLAAMAAVALALWTWSITSGFNFDAAFVLERVTWFLAVPVWVTALSSTRHSRYSLELQATIFGISRAAAVLFIAYLAMFFYFGRAVLPRLMAVYFVWDAALLSIAARMIAGWAIARQGRTRRVLVVGEGTAADSALELLKQPLFADMHVAGVVGAYGPDLAGGRSLLDLARQMGATDLIVAAGGDVPRSIAEGALLCQVRGIEVTSLSELYEQAFRRVPVRHLGPSWVLSNLVGMSHGADFSLAKRLLDLLTIAVVGLGALVLAPLIAMAIVLDSGRPVFYRQVRVGRGGREFWLTKFRTMRPEAEREGPRWSPPGDSRTTRVGRLLRRTRLDEIPNLWSVLRGEMSMVGPRPERSAFIDLLQQAVPLYRARLAVLPGLTGWAQVNHAYTDCVEDVVMKLEYDLYYVKHRSVAFDIVILARTLGTMLGLRGR